MTQDVKLGGGWAAQQRQGVEVQKKQGDPNAGTPNTEQGAAESGGAGESRTPEQMIGQVAHADGQSASNNKSTGGAGEPQTSKLEPEKQGGIGGP